MLGLLSAGGLGAVALAAMPAAVDPIALIGVIDDEPTADVATPGLSAPASWDHPDALYGPTTRVTSGVEHDGEADLEDWQRLADCESGDWDADGDPEPDSRRWDYGLDFDHGDHFQGGLNFHPDTWDAFRDPDMPDHAGHADKETELEVGERVLEEQGWSAWPVCSEMLDLDE